MTCPLGADTSGVIMYVLIATVIFARSLSAAYDICPLGTEEIIHDVFGLSTSKAHVQSGLWHRIPCPSFREGDSIVGVIWYKGNSLDDTSRKRLITHSNGKAFPSSDRYAMSSSSSLVIKGVRDSDKGKYLCHVKTHDTGNREGEIVLEVLGGSFSARTKYSSSTAGLKQEGRQNLRCQCASVTPNAISVVYWSMGDGITEDTEIIGARFANDATIQFQNGVDYSIDNHGTLTVNSVGALHEARFWCHVFQSDGSQTNCYVDVHVSGETPLFGPLRASEASFYLLKGRSQIILCTTWKPGNATCLVQWFKVDISSHHLLINYTVSTSTVHADPSFDLALDFGLVIKSVDEDDGGNYSCSANPEASEGLVEVRVIGDTFPLDGGSATKGDVIAFESDSKFTLHCPAIEGVPIGSRATLIWSFGAVAAQLTTVIGKLDLPAGSKWVSDINDHTCLSLTIEGSLLLTNCSQKDAVRFWCHVFPHGKALRRSYLDVVMRDSIQPSNIGLIAALVSISALVLVGIAACVILKLLKRSPPNVMEQVVYHPIPKTEPALTFNVSTLATMIREFVSEKMNRLPITPWVTGDDSYAAMDDVYTPLEMYLNVSIAGCKARNRIESESEIFDDGISELSSCHVLLEGRSGCGKTAFLSKMASDWSLEKPHAVLGQKKMVFVLPAKNLIEARNIGQTVVQYMLKAGTKHWAKSINEYCSKHPDEVAILVDGCNDTHDIDIVMEIITEQGLLGCQIVISARRTRLAEKTSKHHKLRHITIIGFTQESAKTYIASHCDAFNRLTTNCKIQTKKTQIYSEIDKTQEHKEKDDTNSQSSCDKSENGCENQSRRSHSLIHSYLDTNILHPNVACLPVIITTLCQLSSWTDGLAFQDDPSMGDLFIRLVKCLFERSSDRCDDDTRTPETLNKHVEFDDVTGLSKVQLQILQKLGEVILPKMFENESPATFSKTDLANSCGDGQAVLDVSIKIGLVRCEGDAEVYFVLEILRDFCAGLSLAHTAEQDENWMAELQHTDMMSAAETFSNVYVFVCRKSQTVCSGLVQEIAECKKKDTTNVIGMQTMTQLCLLLNFEGKCQGSLNAKFAGLFEKGKVRLGGVSGHTIRMLSYLFEHVDKPVEDVALCVESVELLRLEEDDWGEFQEYFEYFFPLNLEEDIQETEELQRCSENGTLAKLRERVESRSKGMPQFSSDQSDISVLRTVQSLGLCELLECQAGELHTLDAYQPDQTAQSTMSPPGTHGSGFGIEGSVSHTNPNSGESHHTSASSELVRCLSYLTVLENLVLVGTTFSSNDICNLVRELDNLPKMKKLDLRLNKQFDNDAFCAVANSLEKRWRKNISNVADLRLSLYKVNSTGFRMVGSITGCDGAIGWCKIETLYLLHGDIPREFCDFLKNSLRKKIPFAVRKDRKPYTEILYGKGTENLKPPFCGLYSQR